MAKTFKVFSTFTGIGGFELGIAAAAGNTPVEVVGYSEIDKYAISVYEKHFKGVQNYGDITKIDEKTLPDFDCLVGGFPCQAFSVAGKRAGFADTRGTLFFDLARILRAKRPGLFVFENVKGLLNHDGGNTFRTIIATIIDLGYDCQWEVLNSKNHGVPQNRERVIIVGHLRGQPRPKVFPITGQNGKAVSVGEHEQQRPQSRFIKTRHLSQNGRLVSESTTLQASEIPHIVEVGTLRTHKDGEGFRVSKSGLAPTIPARAREDGSGQAVIRIKQINPGAPQDHRIYETDGISPTINPAAANGGAVIPKIVTAIARRGRHGGAVFEERTDGNANALRAASGGSSKPMVKILTGSPKYVDGKRTMAYRVSDDAPTIRATQHKSGDNQPKVLVEDTKTAYALTATDYKRTGKEFINKHKGNFGIIDGVIRRLTPMECERLQAFPDNWTKYAVGGGEISDSQRYKMCGNAVTTTVIEAVFERIFQPA